MNYWWGWGENVQHLVLGDDGEVRHSRLVPTTGGPMVHDHALSERWVVVYDLPCDFDLERAMAGERLPYHWRPDEPARFGLIDRNDLDGPTCAGSTSTPATSSTPSTPTTTATPS